MYPISDLFRNFIERRSSEYLVKAEVETEEYGMREIVDFTIESNLLTGDEFEIGTVILSQLIIKMRLKGDVPSNARIKPYIAFDTTALTWLEAQFGWNDANMPWSGGASEWMPMGEYYVDSRTKDNDIWRFECFDKLIWSEQAYKSNLIYPATMKAMWDEICTTLGYTYDSTVQINPTYKVNEKPVGYTMRKILGFIAGANGASVKAGKDGRIQFKRYSVTNPTDIELTASDYINAKQTNALKTYTKFVVKYDSEQDLSYEYGTGNEYNTLYYFNPFMTQQMVNNLHVQLDGFSYQPMQMDARGFPHLDPGDEIGYEVYEGSTWETTTTPWVSTHIPWNGLVKYRSIIFYYKLRYGGGFGMALDAPSKSDQQSEFIVPDPVTQAVKQLNQTTVKQNKSYYGVITGHENGLEVKRDDGVSELKLNSDVMDWKVQGQRVLYLDALAKELRFSGTLYGADGVFTGRLEAGEIVGSEIWGSIINGGQINGTSIYGSYISTSEGSFPKVEMSNANNLIRASGSASNYVEMITDSNAVGAPATRYVYGSYNSYIAQIENWFWIRNNYGIITIDGQNLDLRGTITLNNNVALGSLRVASSSATELSQLVSSFNILVAYLRAMGILE